MVAVMGNYQDMVKLLLSYRQINLDVVTKNRSSLAHICLSSKDGVSFVFSLPVSSQGHDLHSHRSRSMVA